jgi:hypothetical protein
MIAGEALDVPMVPTGIGTTSYRAQVPITEELAGDGTLYWQPYRSDCSADECLKVGPVRRLNIAMLGTTAEILSPSLGAQIVVAHSAKTVRIPVRARARAGHTLTIRVSAAADLEGPGAGEQAGELEPVDIGSTEYHGTLRLSADGEFSDAVLDPRTYFTGTPLFFAISDETAGTISAMRRLQLHRGPAGDDCHTNPATATIVGQLRRAFRRARSATAGKTRGRLRVGRCGTTDYALATFARPTGQRPHAYRDQPGLYRRDRGTRWTFVAATDGYVRCGTARGQVPEKLAQQWATPCWG